MALETGLGFDALMVAVLEIQDNDRVYRRHLSFELKSLLHRWGQFIENTRDRIGLPTASAFTRIPGTEGGHRILCADMPKAVYFLNQAILRLERPDQFYLEAWYAWCRDEFGAWLEQSDKADLLGITYVNFRVKVYQCRQKLLDLRNIWIL